MVDFVGVSGYTECTRFMLWVLERRARRHNRVRRGVAFQGFPGSRGAEKWTIRHAAIQSVIKGFGDCSNQGGAVMGC